MMNNFRLQFEGFFNSLNGKVETKDDLQSKSFEWFLYGGNFDG